MTDNTNILTDDAPDDDTKQLTKAELVDAIMVAISGQQAEVVLGALGMVTSIVLVGFATNDIGIKDKAGDDRNAADWFIATLRAAVTEAVADQQNQPPSQGETTH